MRKFIVHTRPIPGHSKVSNAPTIVEVEGKMVTAIEDATILWLPSGEFKFRITAPDWLYEPLEIKQVDGTKQKTMVPPVYYSHAVYYTMAQAQAAAERLIQQEFEFVQRKTGVSFTMEEVKVKCADITQIML